MGLDNFKTDRDSKGVDYSTRKKIENVKLTRTQWEHIALNNPHWLKYFASSWKDKEKYNQIKAAIQLIDGLLEEYVVQDQAVNEETKEDLNETKDHLIKTLKE